MDLGLEALAGSDGVPTMTILASRHRTGCPQAWLQMRVWVVRAALIEFLIHSLAEHRREQRELRSSQQPPPPQQQLLPKHKSAAILRLAKLSAPLASSVATADRAEIRAYGAQQLSAPRTRDAIRESQPSPSRAASACRRLAVLEYTACAQRDRSILGETRVIVYSLSIDSKAY